MFVIIENAFKFKDPRMANYYGQFSGTNLPFLYIHSSDTFSIDIVKIWFKSFIIQSLDL